MTKLRCFLIAIFLFVFLSSLFAKYPKQVRVTDNPSLLKALQKIEETKDGGNGYEVVLMPGKYTVSFTIPKSLSLRGSSVKDVVIESKDSKHLISMESGSSLRDLTIQMAASNTHGIFIENGENISLHNLIIKGNHSIGIYSSKCKGVSILDSTLSNHDYALYTTQTENFSVQYNILDKNLFTGLYIDRSTCKVHKNVISNTTNHGIFSLGTHKYYLRIFASKDSDITQNIFWNNGDKGKHHVKNLLFSETNLIVDPKLDSKSLPQKDKIEALFKK